MPTTEDSGLGLRARHTAAIFIVSLAGLLLEVGYTRIASFKLYYYYVYLVLGLALLGIGSGGILVVVWPRLRRASTDAILATCSAASAVTIAVGYLVIARVPIDTLRIWDYGTAASFKHLGILALVCFVLFISFVALGVILSTLLARAGERVGRLYFWDLIGAGLGCALAIPLIVWLGPPDVVMISALAFAAVAVAFSPWPSLRAISLVGGLGLALVTFGVGLPDVRPETTKASPENAAFSDWGPVFRVDVAEIVPDLKSLFHDGTFGSAIYRMDGDPADVTRFDEDPRALPFGTLGIPPDHTLIIGSAGGNEIQASLHYGSKRTEGVELNPVTVELIEERYREFAGNLPDRPGVTIHQGDGRSFLARGDDRYDLIWFVAPDSYAANNAASSGAFVLSESYLYTSEMIQESLEHLTDRGIMVVQFGELSFTEAPNRSARYVMTARHALREMGIEDPGAHMIVSPYITNETGDLATIMVKRTPFTGEEVDRFAAAVQNVPKSSVTWAPGVPPGDGIVARLVAAPESELDDVAAEYPREISPVRDDAPFFWHFSSFRDVVADFEQPIDPIDPSIVLGERVLLLLLGFAIVFAAVFLLVPFFFVRREWASLPAKPISALYFATLGLGFMLFEITMIQRLVLFLGFPTYSLTVTLASILVFTGLGALLSNRWRTRARSVLPIVFAMLVGLTAFYQFGLDPILSGLLDQPLAVRVLVALAVLAPLGLCLGMFMPFGLGIVSGLSRHPDEYVAWAWAVNGFFSVIGSVLTIILAMSIGFRAVQLIALGLYGIGVIAFFGLRRHATPAID